MMVSICFCSNFIYSSCKLLAEDPSAEVCGSVLGQVGLLDEAPKCAKFQPRAKPAEVWWTTMGNKNNKKTEQLSKLNPVCLATVHSLQQHCMHLHAPCKKCKCRCLRHAALCDVARTLCDLKMNNMMRCAMLHVTTPKYDSKVCQPHQKKTIFDISSINYN